MKTSFSTLTALAVSAMLATAALSACSGGGSTTPTTPAPAQAPTGGNASAPIGTLDLMHPASSTPVTVTSRTPAGPTVDVRDRATLSMTAPASVGSVTVADSASHAYAGGLRTTTSSVHRSTSDVASNAPYDVSYHGGVVLGSAVSHNLFVNCDNACRQAVNFNPGQFLSDLSADPFITLLYQYLTTPGVADTTPLNGKYTKGLGSLESATYASPRPNSTNPYYGQLAIWFLVLHSAGGLGQPDTGLGGGGLGHIYHVFLPKGVDTCFESPPGTPTSNCYSPDNGSTFVFCAYHGAVTFTNQNNQRQTYLYTVEPYQDVSGCRNNVHNQGPLPNAVPGNPSVDPADPGYSTLSHELFETISDPLLNAWYNNFSGGSEIGDICAEFDNFVSVNNNLYVLQSEYSDLHHVCVSANLAGPQQTPVQGPF